LQLVIADTSPINYLLLIGHIDLLPALFNKVVLPSVVREELSHPKAPLAVREWIATPPAWVEIRQTGHYPHDGALALLDAGEKDAIALALELHADLLLMDDEEGCLAARAKGFEVTGTLGVLQRAAQRQLIDLDDAFNRIKRTNFRYRQATMDAMLAEREQSRD
jgi:predicted nucleic acid-binding protein